MRNLMKENVVILRDGEGKPQKTSFCSILNLEGTTRLRLLCEDDMEEVPAAPIEQKWNVEAEVAGSNRNAYILACLPVVLAVVYLSVTHLLRLW